ncbi:MAG: toxin-antitoxin system HicB family antitoxin [Chloroflexota bacterium]|nr:toxin-antitoxin system HicB family antitoxin [Chloroflexota bacterium]
MRQLLARIDEQLHRRLKDRAAVQGRSMNALVTDLLQRGLDAHDSRAQWRARLEQLGFLVEPPAPRGPVPTHEELLARIPRDVRHAIIQQFDEDRKHR